jgi:hypothetical protein
LKTVARRNNLYNLLQNKTAERARIKAGYRESLHSWCLFNGNKLLEAFGNIHKTFGCIYYCIQLFLLLLLLFLFSSTLEALPINRYSPFSTYVSFFFMMLQKIRHIQKFVCRKGIKNVLLVFPQRPFVDAQPMFNSSWY